MIGKSSRVHICFVAICPAQPPHICIQQSLYIRLPHIKPNRLYSLQLSILLTCSPCRISIQLIASRNSTTLYMQMQCSSIQSKFQNLKLKSTYIHISIPSVAYQFFGIESYFVRCNRTDLIILQIGIIKKNIEYVAFNSK